MNEETLLTRLAGLGYRVRTDGETLWVSPSGSIPSGLRLEIAERKHQLIAQVLYLRIWQELEARRERLPERTDTDDWLVLRKAYEALSVALGAGQTDQLELFAAERVA
jgi:hypothetical protein